MSSWRSRSGGIVSDTTLSRYTKSSRNRPALISSGGLRLVAAITRTSTANVFSPPTRRISRSCSAPGGFTCR